MTRYIQTFGYEGLSFAQFIAQLRNSGTAVVIDVRANPLSRKPGFSKKSFSSHLQDAGVSYVHAVGVGCPKPVRDRYRVDNDWSAYTVSYLAFLKEQQLEIAAISVIAAQATACLVCFEADHTRCHRSFVADAVAEQTGMFVQHLRAQETIVAQLRAA